MSQVFFVENLNLAHTRIESHWLTEVCRLVRRCVIAVDFLAIKKD